MVRITGIVNLFGPVREDELQKTSDHIAEVRALAVIIGQADEQRCELRVGRVGLESDRIRTEVLEVPFIALKLHVL